MSSILRLDQLALREAIALSKRGPRADYTVPQFPAATPALTDLVPFYHNATGNLSQAALSALLALSGFGAGIYNVQSYGALGNGTTNDTAAIQAAVSAANGGFVFFPGLTATGAKANYLCGAVSVPAGTTLFGSMGAQITPATVATGMFTFQNGGNTVQGLTFNPGALTAGQYMLYFPSASVNMNLVTGNEFYPTTPGIFAVGNGVSGGPIMTIANNNFLGGANVTCITLTNAQAPIIIGNQFNMGSVTAAFGVALTSCLGAIVTGNTLNGAATALVNIPTSCANLCVVGNNCQGITDVTNTGNIGTGSTLASNNGITSFATPGIPASTVPVTNTSSRPMIVTIFGGTLSAVQTATTYTSANVQGLPFFVKPNGTIVLTYTVAPTWTWTPVV